MNLRRLTAGTIAICLGAVAAASAAPRLERQAPATSRLPQFQPTPAVQAAIKAEQAREAYVSLLKNGPPTKPFDRQGPAASAVSPFAATQDAGRRAALADAEAAAQGRRAAREGLPSVGIYSINGKSSGGAIVADVPFLVDVAGLDTAHGCDIEAVILSRLLPATYPLHKAKLTAVIGAGREMGVSGPPGDHVAPKPPLRELAVDLDGQTLASYCAGAAARPVHPILTIKAKLALNNGGFLDDPEAILEISSAETTTFQAPVSLIAAREPLTLTMFKVLPAPIYKVYFGDWTPQGQVPYRFQEAEKIDCPTNGGADTIVFNSMKNGFYVSSAALLPDRVDTGDGDGFGNPGSRVVLGQYGVAITAPNTVSASWGVWRSHRSPVEVGVQPDASSAFWGPEMILRRAHDICQSFYYLSVTIVGPKGLAPW